MYALNYREANTILMKYDTFLTIDFQFLKEILPGFKVEHGRVKHAPEIKVNTLCHKVFSLISACISPPVAMVSIELRYLIRL